MTKSKIIMQCIIVLFISISTNAQQLNINKNFVPKSIYNSNEINFVTNSSISQNNIMLSINHNINKNIMLSNIIQKNNDIQFIANNQYNINQPLNRQIDKQITLSINRNNIKYHTVALVTCYALISTYIYVYSHQDNMAGIVINSAFSAIFIANIILEF